MDPLSPFERNEPCWCGSARKYKTCHGDLRPRSFPGEPVPHDEDGSFWLAPHTRLAKDALTVPLEGAPLTMPTGRPEPRPVNVPAAVAELLKVPLPHEALSPSTLGMQRFELYAHYGYVSRHQREDRNGLAYAIRDLATATIRSIINLSQMATAPTTLWVDDGDPARLLGQTMLWADHIFVNDRVFETAMNDAPDSSVRDAVAEQRRLRPLIEAGVVIPVPTSLALAVKAEFVRQVTAADLQRKDLVEWVRSQLIFEGPTAREALFVTAKDDIERGPQFWLYSHIDRSGSGGVDDERRFRTKMLQEYDPHFDYGPWKDLVADQATARYVQRLNERCITGDLFAADYLTRSPFEARLLARKGQGRNGPAQSAVWADVPILPNADPRILARAVAEDEAVEDLRAQIRSVLRTARTLSDGADALTNLAEGLAGAGRQLDRTIRTERRWQALGPAVLGGASLALGAGGGLPGILTGALSLAGSLLPYVATHRNRRHNAAFVFYLMQRRRARS